MSVFAIQSGVSRPEHFTFEFIFEWQVFCVILMRIAFLFMTSANTSYSFLFLYICASFLVFCC